MKTRLSLRRINSAACGNHREPRGCCVTHSFTFGFTTRFLQNATEESYRNKAIQACLPSCNSVQRSPYLPKRTDKSRQEPTRAIKSRQETFFMHFRLKYYLLDHIYALYIQISHMIAFAAPPPPQKKKKKKKKNKKKQ